MTTIKITLLSFDKIVSLNTGGLIFNEVYNPQFDYYDAIANVDVDLNTFKNMFCFQTDYIDVNNVSETDVKYYVLAQKLPHFIPALGSSIVSTNPIVSITPNGATELEQFVGKDFIRYLAFLLFNTPYGADLFVNETELVDSVNSALGNAWLYCLADLQNVSNEGNNPNIPLVGVSPAKYLTNDFLDVKNICRELFLQIISKAPERFTNLPQIPVDDVSAAPIREGVNFKYYHLPFIKNDIVQMRVKLYPSVDQPTFGISTTDTTKFETVGNDTHLKGRTYIINMKLTENLPTTTLSIKVVGKNATLSTLDYLPIIQNNNILNITTINTQINSNTIQTDISYTVDTTRDPSASILDVGFGFSENAMTWYNNNIASIEISKFENIPLYGRGSQFKGLSCDIIFTATDVPSISPGTSLMGAFANMPNFNKNVTFLNNWNLLNVTTMYQMFANSTMFNNGSAINDGLNPLTLTTSSVLSNLNYMFSRCEKFNQNVTISDMSGVITMESMFAECFIFNNGSTTNDGLNSLYFNTSSALSNISSMFLSCFAFNQRVTISNMTGVTTMQSMFHESGIFNNGSIMNFAGDPLSWTTSSALSNLTNMFNGCVAFNQTVYFSNMTGVTTMHGMFSGCSSFNNGSISNDGMIGIYMSTGFLLTNVSYMFNNCSSFNQNVNISNMYNITNTKGMFNGCSIFNNGSITNDGANLFYLGGDNCTNVSYMFSGCAAFNQQFLNSGMVYVTTTERMFNGCSLFNNGSPTNNGANELYLNTSNALSNVSYMFNDCSSFNQLVMFIDMSGVTDDTGMYDGCTIFNNGNI